MLRAVLPTAHLLEAILHAVLLLQFQVLCPLLKTAIGLSPAAASGGKAPDAGKQRIPRLVEKTGSGSTMLRRREKCSTFEALVQC
jgi:hypothetical protein